MEALQSTSLMLARLPFSLRCGPSLFQAVVELGGGGENRASSDATELSAFTEPRPFSLIKCTQDGYRTLAHFQSPEILGSDHFCQCSRCFREERFFRYPSSTIFTVVARIDFSVFYSITIFIIFLASKMLIFFECH